MPPRPHERARMLLRVLANDMRMRMARRAIRELCSQEALEREEREEAQADGVDCELVAERAEGRCEGG